MGDIVYSLSIDSVVSGQDKFDRLYAHVVSKGQYLAGKPGYMEVYHLQLPRGSVNTVVCLTEGRGIINFSSRNNKAVACARKLAT